MTDQSNRSIRNEQRREVWTDLRDVAEPDSRFAWDFGSFIADYEGSDDNADRLLNLGTEHSVDEWFVTPDNNLDALRKRLIEDDVPFVMPTYGIRRGFLQLESQNLSDGKSEFASTLDGMNRFAEQLPLEELEESSRTFDCLVTGASFVTTDGLRMGKGHGYFDLEWAMLREVGAVDEDTLVVAAAHDVQVLEDEVDRDEMAEEHDTIVDYIATPTRTIAVDSTPPKPSGIHWNLLEREEIESIPPLETLWQRSQNDD